MMEWKPIETLPRDADGVAPFPVVVAWRVDMSGIGSWWEFDTDELTDCATHYIELPPPPAIGENDE